MAEVTVQAAGIEVAAEMTRLPSGRGDIGALVTFTGLCRDEAGTLAALDIEHYPGMAEAEILRVAEEAERRFSLQVCRVVHRFGTVLPGETIVFVATASAHRAEAFRAADFLMDYLKTRAPFWKRNRMRDGRAADWVAPKAADDQAVDRWASSP